MKQKTKIIISAILVITWMVVIFCFSAVPADESNRQSLNIVNKAIESFEAKSSLKVNKEAGQTGKVGQVSTNKVSNNNQLKQTEDKKLVDSNNQTNQKLILKLNRLLRKSAHASVYFILYLLVLNLIYQLKDKYKFAYCMTSIVLCFIYACTDEFHQLFVDGRAGLFSDVIIDTIGATISFIIVEMIYRISNIIHNNKNNIK